MSTWNPKANDIFLHAIELASAAERRKHIDAACADNESLRAEVEALLAAGDQAGSFLQSNALTRDLAATLERPTAERLGSLIGRYKLLEQIGEGGFGIVFMAEQQEPVRRKVALKVLKPGMDTRQVVARFEGERQALALMDHPNIAHVFDGGTTAAGRPYFVMDLVKGVPITEYCDQNQIAPRERLELFAQVCEAVQHAHQKGIIHRDIKPSNVLISRHDGTPVAKVIDFGIAKALGQQLTEKTLFTNFAQFIGTPLYMSPEQAGMSDLDVDTRSDIYSLGVLLYELLTGTTPFDPQRFKEAGFDEMRRIIREEEPPKPSTRISTIGAAAETASVNRRGDRKQLSRLFRGELDWIVMKALEKDRDRRYETANGLALDVKRYLRDEPVLACPPSAAYRFRKFARRKKATLAMAACVLVALSGVTGGVGWAVRDTAARDEASKLDRLAREKALDLTVERSLDETDSLMEADKWPEALAIVQRAEHLLAAAGRIDQPKRLRELNNALAVAQRLEGIYRGPSPDLKLWLLPSIAEESEEGGLRRQPIHDEAFFWGRQQDADFARAFRNIGIDVDVLSPADAAAKIRQQSIHAALVKALDGWVLFRKRSRGEGDAVWKKLIEIARQADPDDRRNRCRDALLTGDRTALENLAGALPLRETPPASICLLARTLADMGAVEKAMTLLERAQHEYPGDVWLNDLLAYQSWNACQPPRWEAALRYYAAVLALRPDFALVHQFVADALRAKGVTDDAMIEYSKAIELDAKNVNSWIARGAAFEALSRHEEALADYSKVIELQPTKMSAWQRRSKAFLAAGRHDKALADANKALEFATQDKEVHEHRSTMDIWELGISLESLARHFIDLGQPHDAERCYRDANDLWQGLTADSSSEDYRFHLAVNDDALGDFLKRHGRAEEAVESYREARAVWEKLVAEFNHEDRRQHLAWTDLALGELDEAAGRLDDAAADYRRAAEVWDKLIADFPRNVGYGEHCQRCLVALAKLYAKQGKVAEAEQIVANVVGSPHPDQNVVKVFAALAEFYWQGGRPAEAIETRRKAVAVMEHLVRENPDSADYLQRLSEATTAWSATLASAGRAEEALQPLLTIADVAEKRLHVSVAQWRSVRAVHEGLARFYFNTGRIADGAKAFDLLIERRPQEHAVWGRRGEFYARLGLWDRAARDFATDWQLGSAANPRQWLMHALLSLESGDVAAYREVCRRLPTIFKTPADCAGLDNELVRACCIAQSPDADLGWALRISESAVQRSPHAAWEQFALGLARYRAGDDEGAVTTLNQSTGWQAGCLSHPALALAYHRLGREQQAREALDHATQAINRLAERHLWTPVGTIPMLPSDWLSALLLYREAVTVVEGRAPADDARQIAAQARSWAALGETKAADEACRRALELGAEHFQVCLACAATHAELGQRAEAEAALAAAVRLEAASVEDLQALAFVAEKLGKRTEVIAAYAKIVEVAPNDAVAHNNLAWIYATSPALELRDPAKAIALAKKAVELKPSDGTGWNTLGVAQYRAGDWQAAIDALSKSMELRNGGDAFDWFFLAMARWRKGDKEEARKLHVQAIEWMEKSQPNDTDLKRFRAEAVELLGVNPPEPRAPSAS